MGALSPGGGTHRLLASLSLRDDLQVDVTACGHGDLSPLASNFNPRETGGREVQSIHDPRAVRPTRRRRPDDGSPCPAHGTDNGLRARQFPCRLLRYGGTYRVVTAELLELLGVPLPERG
ncbi:hypothetical protein GCM10009642_44290 [Nocardiopsis metallicus]